MERATYVVVGRIYAIQAMRLNKTLIGTWENHSLISSFLSATHQNTQ